MLEIAPLGRALAKLKRDIEKDSKQAKFATAVALTKTAKLAQANIRTHMQQVFKAPTRFTLNATFVKPATKANLETVVGLKEGVGNKVTDPDKYLGPQEYGGRRRHKRFERSLIRAGIMGQFEFAVPGKDIRLNKFGNMTRGNIQKILSGVGARQDSNQNSRSSRGYFVGGKGAASHLPRGIYLRMAKRKIIPVLRFVRPPTYAIRLRWTNVIQETFDKELGKQYDLAFNSAIKTARFRGFSKALV